MPAWSIQFSAEAIGELKQAIEYYDFQRSGLGVEFMIEFDEQIRLLSVNLFARAVRYLNVRLAIIDRFPYAIHFVIKEELNIIVIQTVLSTFKNPGIHWKER